jgi:hypothetical protein
LDTLPICAHTQKDKHKHMRTKTLLLTAALSAAGLATSMAQVYSVNAVGYVNQTVPANGLAILAIPLNGTNNQLNTTMWLPNGFDGTIMYRYDDFIQNYQNPLTWFEGVGWAGDEFNPTVNPGEGVWIQNIAGQALTHTFVGEVPAGTLNNAIPGGNALKLASSVVPKSLPIGRAGSAATLGFPAGDGDNIFIFDPTIQNYKEVYTYFDPPGVWASANPDDPGVDGPVIAPGTGFWSQKVGSAATWTQTFSVN